MDNKNKFDDEPKITPYEKYFEKTKQLIKHFQDDDLKIKDNVRTFRVLNTDNGYDEVFISELQKIFGGMSSHISFLFPPGVKTFQNMIGFRYYKYDPLNSTKISPYFTLVNAGLRKFIILEKDSIIKDADGKPFTLEDLDCLDVIISIIKNKNKNDEDNFSYPYTIPEILGFIYAIKTLKINNLIIKDPYYPSPSLPQTMTENFDYEDETKDVIIPILYNNHVSILLIHSNENRDNSFASKKNYYLIDMNGVHYNSIRRDPVFNGFSSRYIEKFPENNLQLGKSSSLWFFASLLVLIKTNIEFPIDNNTLSQIIDKLYELVNISEPDFSYQKLEDKDNLNILYDTKFLSYKMSFRTFIDIEGLMKQFYGVFIINPSYIKKYQNLFYKMKSTIDLYKLNNKYYFQIFHMKIFDSFLIEGLENILQNSLKMFERLIERKKELFNYLMKQKFEISLLNLRELIKMLEEEIEELEKSFQYKTEKRIYTREELHQMYYEHNDIYLSMMD